MNRSRLNKVSRNLMWHVIYEVIIIVFGFAIPKLIIDVYGSEINGLSSTISQTVILVTLLQSGITTTSVYRLYKPVNECDKKAITETLYSVDRAFKRIGIAVISIGIFASLIIVFSINSEQLEPWHIYMACLLFFIKTTLDICFCQKCKVLFTARQDNYILSISQLIDQVVYYGLQLIVIFLRLNFLFMYFTLVTGCFGKLLFLTIVYRRNYEQYRYTGPEEIKNVKIGGMKYATINEVSHTLVASTIPIAISFFCGLAYTSVFSVYIMVFNALVIVSKAIYSSFSSSYGSMTAEGNISHTNEVFEIFLFCFMMLTTWLFSTAAYLYLPFINLYVGGATDAVYVDVAMMIAITIYGCFYSFRIPYNLTVSANGIFKETYLQPLVSAIVTIAISFVITRFNYVLALVGPTIFYAMNTFYQHFIIPKYVKGFINEHFWKHFLVSAISVTIFILMAVFLPFNAPNFFIWVGFAVLTGVVNLVIVICLSFILDRKSMMNSIGYFRIRLLKR